MDKLTSRFPESKNVLRELQNHDNFVINNQETYSELVECAEHFVLACQNNPGFVSKIINAEYDLLIGDDVSGRPITLMIKYIIDYYRKAKGIKGGIDNIFIDNACADFGIKLKQIIKNKKILFCTDVTYTGSTFKLTAKKLKINSKNIDIFAQSAYDGNESGWKYKTIFDKKKLYNALYYGNNKIKNKIYESGGPKQMNLGIGIHSNFGNGVFAGTSKEYFDSEIIAEYRLQIKLLSQYIIDNYLKV